MSNKYFADYCQNRSAWCLWKSISFFIMEFVEVCKSEEHANELADMMNEGE